MVVLYQEPETPKKLAESLAGPYKLLSGKYYRRRNLSAAIVRPLVWISDKVLWHVVDERVIDGTVNGVGNGLARIGRPFAPRQFRQHSQLRQLDGFGRRGCLLPCCSGWWTDVQQSYLLTVLTFLPLAGTLALLLLRERRSLWIRRLAWPPRLSNS